MSKQQLYSPDPASIPDKAKVKFSRREFGYIAAEQYCRLNRSSSDGGWKTRNETGYVFGFDEDEERAFRAGWDAYMVQKGRVSPDAAAEEEEEIEFADDQDVEDDSQERRLFQGSR